ncbi:MAG: NAD+ synthase [bacterium]
MNCEEVANSIARFIKDEVTSAGLENGVIGLSGGIDSSVVASLATKALGREHLFALIMPYKTSSKENIEDAQQLADSLAIHSRIIDITTIADTYFSSFSNADVMRKGNIMARLRMAILYDHAAFHKALVVGTGNKTEIFLGYFTKYGDGGVDIEPIGDLYKKEVRELANFLHLSKTIIEKQPTADLWTGQTDEAELGLTYDNADEILSLLVDKKYGHREICALGYDKEDIERVISLFKSTGHKRTVPKIPKIIR